MSGIDWNDISKKANGGTEAMCRALEKHIPEEILNKFQIVPSRLQNPLQDDKFRLFWAHDLPGDPASDHLAKGGWTKFDKLVFVSHWQQQAYLSRYGIPWHKTVVLQNAIESIEMSGKPDPKERVNLIYTPTPHRGLNILVPVFKKLAEDDSNIHLDVFSSFNLYGWGERDQEFKALFKEIEDHPQMTYHGTQPNEKVREALVQAHIFAYPSIWYETSCMCLMEAMSAGCLCVHSSLGALPETSANWTWMYNYPGEGEEKRHAALLYAMLQDGIAHVRSTRYEDDIRLKGMKSYADVFYSWDLRKQQWLNFLSSYEGAKPTPVPKKEGMFEYSTSR